MNIIFFFVGLLLLGLGFKAGQNWQRRKSPTPIDLATYLPPQLPRAQETEPIPAWFDSEALDLLSREG